jgi:hypothetical protein
MGDIATIADEVWRDSDDTPGSPPHKPIKSEIRDLFREIDGAIGGGGDFRGPFPNDNIWLSEEGLANIIPGLTAPSDGCSNVAIGNHAMEFTTTGNATVAIGSYAGQYFGQKVDLVVNGDFAAGSTGWTLGAGWTVASGAATHAPGSASNLSQIVPMVEDVPYTIRWTVTGRTAGTIQRQLTGGTTNNGPVQSINGTFSEPAAPNLGNTTLAFVASSDFDGSVSAVAFNELSGRSSVFLGFVAGQFVGQCSSNTFVGGFCGQGLEHDVATGIEISGTHPLGGGDNCGVGEATLIRIRSGANGNVAVGFNAGFNLETGDQNVAIGTAACMEGNGTTGNVGVGTSAYKYGYGDHNTFVGMNAGSSDVVYTTLAAPVSIGGFIFTAVDASIFQVGGVAINNTFINARSTITAINLGTNQVTVDKAFWADVDPTGGRVVYIYSQPNPHIGIENVGVGYLAGFDLAGNSIDNVFVGAQSGRALVNGNDNTFIGRNAGGNSTAGDRNIMIGSSARTSIATASQELNIGNTIFGTAVGLTVAGKIGIGARDPTSVLDINDSRVRIRTAKTPLSASAAGNQGDICWDANFVYVCIATNSWKRVAIAAW